MCPDRLRWACHQDLCLDRSWWMSDQLEDAPEEANLLERIIWRWWVIVGPSVERELHIWQCVASSRSRGYEQCGGEEDAS